MLHIFIIIIIIIIVVVVVVVGGGGGDVRGRERTAVDHSVIVSHEG